MKIRISKEEKTLSLVVAVLIIAQFAVFGIEYRSNTAQADEVMRGEHALDIAFLCEDSGQKADCVNEDSLDESDLHLLSSGQVRCVCRHTK